MKTIFEGRVVGVCDEMAKEGWSISASAKIEEIREEICKVDQEKLPKLLDEYDDLFIGMHCKTVDKVYVQGFRDAIALMRF